MRKPVKRRLSTCSTGKASLKRNGAAMARRSHSLFAWVSLVATAMSATSAVMTRWIRRLSAEANLAACLQSIAEGGKIVISYETYALVKDIVDATPLPPITMKGIHREIVPYGVNGLIPGGDQTIRVMSNHFRAST